MYLIYDSWEFPFVHKADNKWVQLDDEAEIRAVFTKTMQLRAKSPEARELADQYFFETLVRMHRAGEGAPYSGLKPSGTDLGPEIVGADRALETGAVNDFVKLVADQVVAGIRERFAHAREKRAHITESVPAGREYVEAYVNFVHFVERMYLDATTEPAHYGETAGEGEQHH